MAMYFSPTVSMKNDHKRSLSQTFHLQLRFVDLRFVDETNNWEV